MKSGLEIESDQEILYEVKVISTCLELLKSNDDWFTGEKAEGFVSLARDLFQYHRENSDFFNEIVVKDQNERRERDRAFSTLEDWDDLEIENPTAPVIDHYSYEEPSEEDYQEEIYEQNEEDLSEFVVD